MPMFKSLATGNLRTRHAIGLACAAVAIGVTPYALAPSGDRLRMHLSGSLFPIRDMT